MPAPSPRISTNLKKALRDLGLRLRTRRKELGISATTTAEAAGMSRMTLNRIERGEPSVAMGAYLSVVFSLGLSLELEDPQNRQRGRATSALMPLATIRIADFPQLKKLAWQLKGAKDISPEEALELYERNWRHVDVKSLSPREKELLETLLKMFGKKRLLV